MGGGTPCFYNNLQLINASSISIYLKTNVTILFERLIKSKYQRPTIEHMDEDALQNFIVTSLEKRKPYYNKAHFIVENTEIEATIHQLNEIMAFK